jgi:hypothetical protein
VRYPVLFIALAIAVLTAGVYAPAMRNGTAVDDAALLAQDFSLTGLVFDTYYRPVAMASWAIFEPLPAGAAEVRAAHAVNIALHAATAAAVLLLCVQLVGDRAGAIPGAAAGALLFALHPVHSEVGAQINTRFDLLAAIFMVLAVLAYIRYRAARRWRWLAAAGTAAVAAPLSKESGLAVFVLIPLLELTSAGLGQPIRAAGRPIVRRGRRPPPDTVARRLVRNYWPAAAVLAAALLLYGLLRLAAGTGTDREDFNITDVAPAEVIGSVGFYATRLIAPHELLAYHVAVPHGARDIAVGALALAVVAAAVVAGWRWNSLPLLFGALWTPIALAPSIAVLGYGGRAAPLAERYLYAPSVGLALCVAALVATLVPAVRARLPGGWPRRAAAAGVTVTFAIAALAVVRIETHIPDFRNVDAYWESVLETDPDVGLAYVYLAGKAAARGDQAEAERQYLRALDAELYFEQRSLIWFNLATRYDDAGRTEDARHAYEQAVATLPESALYRFNLAEFLRRMAFSRTPPDRSTLEQAREEAARAVELEPAAPSNGGYLSALALLGQLQEDLGDYGQARAIYGRLVVFNPASEWAAYARERLAALACALDGDC